MFKYHLFLLILFCLQLGFSQENSIVKSKDTMVIGYSINPPFLYKNNGTLEGVSYWMWEELIKTNNRQYVYKEQPLDSLLIGLRTGEIDLVISPLTITSERNAYVQFSFPYYVANSTFMVHKISSKNKFLGIFKSVFSWSFMKILLTLFLLLLLFGFLVWFFERKKNPEEFGEGRSGIWHGLWWSAVTMTTVGYGDKSPKTVGGRIVGLIWMFAGIMLISGITASITTSLTVNKLAYSSEDIHSFRSSHIGTVQDSATEKWLRNNFFTNISTFESFEELVQGFRENEIDIVAYDEPLLQYTIKNEKNENWTLLNIQFNESMYAFGASKFLPGTHKEVINHKILLLKESDRWKQLLFEYDLLK